MEEKRENFFTELLKLILVVLIVVVPIRLWVAKPFIVSGASMEPTFDTGQYLIIDEFTYHFDEPKRFDVVVFRYPKDPSKYYIKRVVGLPGEVVRVTDDSVSVTSQDGTTETLSEPYLTFRGNGGVASTTLKDGEYFVMGDNRPDSSDSRFWGALPRENIAGRAFIRLLPITLVGLFPGRVEGVPRN